jgi:hypothetical protein
MNLFTPPKRVKGTLFGVDSNSFSLLAYFSKQAKKQGWSLDEINTVLNSARSGDYQNLISVLDAHLEK